MLLLRLDFRDDRTCAGGGAHSPRSGRGGLGARQPWRGNRGGTRQSTRTYAPLLLLRLRLRSSEIRVLVILLLRRRVRRRGDYRWSVGR
jgi:hypothetical protein